MSRNETQQKLLDALAERWLREGKIADKSEAWALMEEETKGHLSRTSARGIAESKMVAKRSRSLEGVSMLTGRSVTELRAMIRRWIPHPDSNEGMRREIERLEEDLRHRDAQIEALKLATGHSMGEMVKKGDVDPDDVYATVDELFDPEVAPEIKDAIADSS